MKKTMTLIAALIALTCQHAMAGDNSCAGVIDVGKEWTTMVDKDMPDNTCRFKTNSDMGRKILAACPHGSFCWVEMPLLKDQGGNDRNTKRIPVIGAVSKTDTIIAPVAKIKVYQ